MSTASLRSGTGQRLAAAELAAWRGMLRVTVSARRELGRRLQRDHALSMAEYDTLVPIAARSDRRIRMTELAEVVLQPRSTVTRLVSGLQDRGYLVRTAAPEDGRGAYAALTPPGQRRFLAAQIAHHQGIRELVTDRLTDSQLSELAAAWTAIDPAVDTWS